MSTSILLLTAGLAAALSVAGAFKAPRLWLSFVLVAAMASLAAAVGTLAGGGVWELQSGWTIGGERVHFRLDGLSAFFLALLAVIGGTGAVYSQEYWTDAAHPRSAGPGRAWWSAMLTSMGMVLLCANGLHFLIAWELFAVTAFFLITLERRWREVRDAGWLYLGASHAGSLCLFGFFAMLAVRTGSWDLGPMRDRPELAPLFWLALAGFGLKAGLFPLHIWLPSAHANAPSHVSAILSGVAIKMGVYGLVRFSGWLPVPEAGGWVVAVLGVVSAVLGVAFALGQHDLKRLLAYHSVENVGIILIGLGFAMIAAHHGHPAWGALALAGGLLHVWNHGLFKGLLFLGAGSVLHATGTREMSRLGGLWKAMPWTAGCFGLGAAAISALPPLNGFVSEWLVYLGLFDAVNAHDTVAWLAIPAIVLLAMTGALALACFVKVCGIVFLGVPRSRAAESAHECGWRMRGAMLLLSGLCVAIGLVPVVFWPAVQRAVVEWRAVEAGVEAPLMALAGCNVVFAVLAAGAGAALWWHVTRRGIRRAPTWDCGYAAPTARMQYTAGSFAGIITEWFAWILQPARHRRAPEGVFPALARQDEHTPETVLEKVVQPAGSVVMTLSTAVRRLQHGRIQSYIVYLLLGLLVLSVLVFAWASSGSR
ncbi:MAG TPA: NADH-quinone oxidoreductase subunit H [Verrucomicrobia bacterium]|nr:NADH-quinone oxidoreductase subunit H [Verrucomicrobiota bacterium]HOP97182.1 proton-conducting transporter membrane subunit [Verrucomicrobiota bacterium]